MRFIIVLCVLGGIFFYTTEWYLATAYVCPAPISYRVGMTDDRFAITDTELRAILASAEETWEQAIGRELFVYDETSDFTINLVYDDRQQLASTEEEWRMRLDAQQKEHEALLAELTSQSARYESEQASYNTRREAYEQKLVAYNDTVERFNEGGGAPREEYAKLENEADTLRREARALSALEQEINGLAAAINTLGEEGNKKIAAYNAEVLEYNEIFGSFETFTQGDYKRERINIYKFIDTAELARVITHEFGHALGVSHVEGEASVMYYLMTDKAASTLSPEDTTALTAVCGTEATWQQTVRHVIRTTLTKFN